MHGAFGFACRKFCLTKTHKDFSSVLFPSRNSRLYIDVYDSFLVNSNV